MSTYTVPAPLLQQVVNVLNQRPAGEVFMLLLALKEEVDRQDAEKAAQPQPRHAPPIPTMGRQE